VGRRSHSGFFIDVAASIRSRIASAMRSDDVVKTFTPSMKLVANWEPSFERNKRGFCIGSWGRPCGDVAALPMYLRQLRTCAC
jgi:hypothetical protein